MSNVLSGPCTSLFRKILRKYVPEMDFVEKLDGYKTTLLPLLDDAQQRLLYPERGPVSVSYRRLDLHLLYILLRNICDIAAHEHGWGNSPNPTDMSLAANIDRIMDISRAYCDDAPHVILTQSDFDRVMKKVIQISGKIEEILEGSSKDVGTHDQGTATKYIQGNKEKENLTDQPMQLDKEEHVLGALRGKIQCEFSS